MALKDLCTKVKPNAAYSSGDTIDTAGYMSLSVISYTQATTALTITHSDDDSTYSAVAATDIIKSDSVAGAVALNVLTYTAAGTSCFGYTGKKRYVKVAVANPPVDATVTTLLGDPQYAPV